MGRQPEDAPTTSSASFETPSYRAPRWASQSSRASLPNKSISSASPSPSEGSNFAYSLPRLVTPASSTLDSNKEIYTVQSSRRSGRKAVSDSSLPHFNTPGYSNSPPVNGKFQNSRRSSDYLALALSPSQPNGAVKMPDWPTPEECDASYDSAKSKYTFCGPLAYLYPDGYIDWPHRRYSAAEWAQTMSESSETWPTLSAESCMLTTACQSLLISADRMRRALNALALVSKKSTGDVLKMSLVDKVCLPMYELGHYLDSLWEIHAKYLSKMDQVARLKFPGNLESLHFRAHRKAAALIAQLDAAVLRDTIPGKTMRNLAEEFKVLCTFLLRISQVTLEDAIYFYRVNFSQSEFMRMEHRISFPILRSDNGVAARMLVGATPACQRSERLRNFLHSTSGLLVPSSIAVKLYSMGYEKHYSRPLENVLTATARRKR
uniref:Uncharacterized protein n=1 Tax=Tetraselmis chuii TaxID=63592 RepID=A0A7S1X313_9CHLO|mmetsp:Transcript_2320/g.4092  ORF Transcript_2320/g.4092 Transcript_2320/m.4092 type:complete len:434 (+) Transcript_2320:323-1624(+)